MCESACEHMIHSILANDQHQFIKSVEEAGETGGQGLYELV